MQTGTLWIGLMLILSACAAPVQRAADPAAVGAAPPGTPKRITAAILGNPHTLSQSINSAGTGSIRGVSEMEKVIAAGLTQLNNEGNLQPQLAEAVPSLENGLWKLGSDGTMETTWRIKPSAKWHDGTPVTAEDMAFTIQVALDKDLAFTSYPGLPAIDRVTTPDPHTVSVTWKRAYIEADRLFSHDFVLPLPKHVLEGPYTTDKAAFLEQPYWTTGFVGSGPFRVREFVRDSHMVLAAFEDYVLGRPKLTDITVKFLPDPNALIANVLAGEVHLSVGRGFNLEQLLQASQQWADGKMESKPANWIAAYPQFLTPDPPILKDVRFRRALLQAIDRQAMSDSLQAGHAPVAHAWLEITSPYYKDVESSIVKYEYNARQATQAIEGLGYARGADGLFADPSGRRLSVQIMTNVGDDVKEKMVFTIADYWQRAGVGAETVMTPRQLASNREYRATYPGFDVVRQPFEPERLLSSEAPLPENRFVGKNRTRYSNPEMDVLIEKFVTTVPRAERVQTLGQMLRLMTEDVAALGIFYAPEPMLISNRLVDVHAAKSTEADETWNAHLWDLR
jgi:peptide/nickel transport system substrate-binding protein